MYGAASFRLDKPRPMKGVSAGGSEALGLTPSGHGLNVSLADPLSAS